MRPMSMFEKVPPVVEFPDSESQIRDFWKQRKIFEKTLRKAGGGEPPVS